MKKYDNYERNILQGITNIIFDMDGTLINTALATIPACQETAEKYGLPLKSSVEIKQLIGYTDPEFCYRLYPGFDKEILNKYSVDVGKKETEIIQQLGTNILFPGIQELLKTLKLNGFYMAIASTGSVEHVNVSLHTSGIYNMFDEIKCNEPEKTEMVKCIVEYGPKGEWLVIGDKNSDLRAGKNNNIITVAASYGFGTENEYELFKYRINTPLQLLELLSS